MSTNTFPRRPEQQITALDVVNSAVFGPAVLRAVQDPRLRGYLVGKSVPWDAVDVPLVSDLPVAPKDGAVIHFLADSANGVIWTLRYRAGAPSTYRWEFIGGPPHLAESNATESTALTTFQDLTSGMTIALPFEGDYDITTACLCENSSDGGFCIMSPEATGLAATDEFGVRVEAPGAGRFIPGMYTHRAGGISGTLDVRFRVSAGTGTWVQKSLAVTPVRVG